MYLVASQWKFGSPSQAREALRRLRDDFGPLIRDQPGLQSWYLATTGADEAMTISLWTSRAAYEAAQPVLATRLQACLVDLEARVQFRRRGDVAAREGQ